MFLRLLISMISTEAAKQLAVYTVNVLAKRTDNTIDDTVVVAVAKLMGVAPPAA